MNDLVGGFSPTHLTNMRTVKMGDFLPPIFGVNIPKIFELPPPSEMMSEGSVQKKTPRLRLEIGGIL